MLISPLESDKAQPKIFECMLMLPVLVLTTTVFDQCPVRSVESVQLYCSVLVLKNRVL